MRMRITFWLPRNAESVSVARMALDRIFCLFGVRTECREEIALAVSEACSNAVSHAEGEPVYQLAAESHDSDCVITVDDLGPGLGDAVIEGMPGPQSASGRGLALMRVSSDAVQFTRRRGGGLSVRISKRLLWRDGALGALPA
jgi:serine/threonine-protein kinase RsbW